MFIYTLQFLNEQVIIANNKDYINYILPRRIPVFDTLYRFNVSQTIYIYIRISK